MDNVVEVNVVDMASPVFTPISRKSDIRTNLKTHAKRRNRIRKKRRAKSISKIVSVLQIEIGYILKVLEVKYCREEFNFYNRSVYKLKVLEVNHISTAAKKEGSIAKLYTNIKFFSVQRYKLKVLEVNRSGTAGELQS
ncbi:hypothetical protein M0R45_006392 [Rubus argutus]|uniref:Uncharacterized protein n=1 Tax=Rubus argutus TaxID=59490 RepID=A0AAW1YQD6_RUBAR